MHANKRRENRNIIVSIVKISKKSKKIIIDLDIPPRKEEIQVCCINNGDILQLQKRMYQLRADENSIVESVIEKQLQRLRKQESTLKKAMLVKTRHSILNSITQTLNLYKLDDSDAESNYLSPRSAPDHAELFEEFKCELIPTKLKKQYEELNSEMHQCDICTKNALGFDYKTRQKINFDANISVGIVLYLSCCLFILI